MDEPLSNLDAKLRVQTRTQIAALQRRLGVTTVYVTHDQVEAMTMGDRVAVLKDGVLHQCASPRELFTRPINTFVAGFIGSPAMNLLEGRIEEGGVALGSTVLPIPSELRAKRREPGGLCRHRRRPPGVFWKLVPSGQGVPAVVNLVEELGAEAFVYAQLADHLDRSRDGRERHHRPGGTCRRARHRRTRSSACQGGVDAPLRRTKSGARIT